MTVSISNLSAELIFHYLDINDDAEDDKISASIWNKFIDETKAGNGDKSKIKYRINKQNIDANGNKHGGAIASLNSYLYKASDEVKQNIVNFLNSLSNKPDTESRPESPVGKKPQQQASTKNNIQTKRIELCNSFSQETQELNARKYEHDTVLLEHAQDSLGIVEVTREEFQKLSPEEKEHTQFAMIGDNGSIDDQWCAHAVSTLSQQSGMDIGKHKISVLQFINWGGERYHSISTTRMTANNFEKERINRESQIKTQLSDMHEGDYIIWKTNYMVQTSDGNISKNSSHIGIIEKIDLEKGIVTVIEGNANCCDQGENYDRKIVHTTAEGKNGAQVPGEFQELNKRDGLIRKEYTIEELAKFGYSGYIDNTSIVK